MTQTLTVPTEQGMHKLVQGAAKIDEMVELQSKQGAYDSSSYARGIANGLLGCQAALKGEEAVLLQSPPYYTSDFMCGENQDLQIAPTGQDILPH